MIVVSEKRKGKTVPVLYGNNGVEIMVIPKVRIAGKDYMDIPQKYLKRIDQNPPVDTLEELVMNVTERIAKGFFSSLMTAGSFNELMSNRNRDEQKRLRELFEEAHKNTRR